MCGLEPSEHKIQTKWYNNTTENSRGGGFLAMLLCVFFFGLLGEIPRGEKFTSFPQVFFPLAHFVEQI